MSTSHQHSTPTQAQPSPQRESRSSLAYPSRTIVHAKLEMTEPGDHDEQEADVVANTIVRGGKIARKISGGDGSSGIAVSQQMESQLSQLQGGGRQMPEGLRNMMESGFGQDFSQVRLHTDSEAASMSSSIHAKAFTLGNDIYFNHGQFSPSTTEGQRLVAHELTHVAQGGNYIKRLPWYKFPCHYDYVEQDLMNGDAINDSTRDVTDEEKKDSPQPQETDFDRLKRIVQSEDVDALIDLLVRTAVKEAEIHYKEKESAIGSEALMRLTEIEKQLKKTGLSESEKKELKEEHHKQKGILENLDLENPAGEGTGNFTKYPQELDQVWGLGDMWCDWFVHWCFVKAFHPKDIKERASDASYNRIRDEILKYTMYEEKLIGGVPRSITRFQNPTKHIDKKYKPTEKGAPTYISRKDEKNKPTKGDVIFFYKEDKKTPGHIGLVTNTDEQFVYTVEGNTVGMKDGENNVEADGGGGKGGVYQKRYELTYDRIAGYGRPNYHGLLNYLKGVFNWYDQQQRIKQRFIEPLLKLHRQQQQQQQQQQQTTP